MILNSRVPFFTLNIPSQSYCDDLNFICLEIIILLHSDWQKLFRGFDQSKHKCIWFGLMCSKMTNTIFFFLKFTKGLKDDLNFIDSMIYAELRLIIC